MYYTMKEQFYTTVPLLEMDNSTLMIRPCLRSCCNCYCMNAIIPFTSNQQSCVPPNQFLRIPIQTNHWNHPCPNLHKTKSTAQMILATPFAEFLCPILELLETLFTDTRPDVDQTCFEVHELYRPNLVHRHVKKSFAQ